MNESTEPATSNLSEKARKRQNRRIAKQQHQKNTSASPNALAPRNQAQSDLLYALRSHPVVFALGPAGVGKTYLPARHAMQQLMRAGSLTQKIIVTRPTAAPARHRLGFQPGNNNGKMRPWLVPIWEGFKAETSAQNLDKLQQQGQVEIVPFEHMRGRSFDNCMILLDEAQNCCFADLKLMITRVGEASTLVITGDPEQVDIDDSGLTDVARMVPRYDLNAAVVRFTDEHVVRSAVAAEWVKAFRSQQAFGLPSGVIPIHA